MNAKYGGAATGGRCVALPPANLAASVAAVEEVVRNVAQHTAHLDCLVNNSGVSWGEAFDTHSEKGYTRVFDLNVKALFFLTQKCLPLLEEAVQLKKRNASIINIASIAGLQPQSAPTYAYDSSKA